MLEMDDGSTMMDRRAFFSAGAGIVAASGAISNPTVAIERLPAGLQVTSLNGKEWQVCDPSRRITAAAEVPGDIFTDLMAAGHIPDPYFRDNNGKVQWVGRTAWIYSRKFNVSPELLSRRFIHLRCNGLDTLAVVHINGKPAGRADNMYRTWEFDVKKLLRPGENSIEIRFNSTNNYASGRAARYKAKTGLLLNAAQAWVRKAPYMWGWDWCRPLLTCGIWRPIELVGFEFRITDVNIQQDLTAPLQAVLHASVEVGGAAPAGMHAEFTVMFNGAAVCREVSTVIGGHSRAALRIDNPQRWWPNGMGPQHLYVVKIDLVSADGRTVESAQRKIGLRTIHYLGAKNGKSVRLAVNGVSFFAKGADWVPPDNIPTRVQPQTLRQYIQDARDCHFNLLRFWGGGYYEPQEQFDACDELGIMVLFEFKFANHFYPVFDEAWLENVRLEVQEQVRRNRHHPCIALWSGNNEIYLFKGFEKLFRDTIGATVIKELPGANYETGSGDPFTSNDIHYWSDWHVINPPAAFSKARGFISEFGMQSFPSPRTVAAYTTPPDRRSLYSPVMVYHERSWGRAGIDAMLRYVNQYFGPTPANFDSALWLTQIMQAYIVGYGVEHWRRQMPESMASLIWQLNDSWPGPTWSMIDWYGRWKAVMYAARRFFSPVLVSAVSSESKDSAELWVTSDLVRDTTGILTWRITDLQGKELAGHTHHIRMPARSSILHKRWTHPDLPRDTPPNNLLIWSSVTTDGEMASRNMHALVAPRDLALVNPGISTSVQAIGRSFRVTVRAAHPALWVWLNLSRTDARYSDNFFHMGSGDTASVNVQPERPMSLADFQAQLQVRTLKDVMQSRD